MARNGGGTDKDGVSRRRFIATTTTGAAATLLHAQGALAGGPTTTAAEAGAKGGAAAPAQIHHGSPAVSDAALHSLHSAARGTSPMGRIFAGLPAHNPTDAALTAMAGRIATPPARNPDNVAIPAGFTFLGQFIDHDITFDQVSNLLGSNDPNGMTSSASARLDLDSVYGDGPAGNPEVYDTVDTKKFRLVVTNGITDLPRVQGRTATMVDSRNDENKIVLHIQLAFMRFHNAMVDRLRSTGTPEASLFDAAQQQVRWHYQWVVTRDYLPRIVGQTLVNSILVTQNGVPTVVTQFYHPTSGNAFMPVEFAVAAFRFGHTQVRDTYRIGGNNVVTSIFPRLNGGTQITSQTLVLLGNFFTIQGSGRQAQASKLIDGNISRPLGALPQNATGDTIMPNLAERNLRRGKSFGLPSGQAVAAAMGAQVFTNAELGLTDPGLGGEAPLWFYILKESELQQGGVRLGQVGGRIVAEVLLGMLAADPTSFINANPTFQPVPPIAPAAGQFTMSDLVRFSGAPV
jgi:Animal haem peroxidase